jgi:general secretion pathway protein C
MGKRIVEFCRSDAFQARSFHHNRRMFARLSAFVIWSLVAATTMFWALRFTASPPRAPAYAVPVDRSAPAHGDLARLFGVAPLVTAANEARPEAASRFRLLGVMAAKAKSRGESSDYGFALIAVDGKPAKAFGVGARLENGLVLQSVGMRSASLGPAQGERSMLLELPTLPAPATGVLPPSGAATLPARIAPRLPVPAPGAPIVGTPVPPALLPQPAAPTGDGPAIPGLPSPEETRSQ